MELRLLDYIYTQQSSTLVTATSENSEFPASNMKHAHRSRVWRSSGYFVITATNNRLDFKESGGGAELAANIPVGSYTPSELAAAIKAAMELVGAETYTVSYSPVTGKWTIASAGAYLALLRASGSHLAQSVWTTIGFTTAADSTGALTYTGANIAIHTEEAVVFDFLTTEAIDSVCLFFDALEGNLLSSTAVIRIQANAVNDWNAPAVDQVLTYDDTFNCATHFFTTDQSYRYWRVKVVDPANPHLFVELSTLTIAKATQFGSLPATGFSYQVNDRSKVMETEYGHRYADEYPNQAKLAFDYTALAYADLKTFERIYRRVGKRIPVVVALDPEAELYDKDHFVIYGYFEGEFAPKHVLSGYFAQAFGIVEGF